MPQYMRGKRRQYVFLELAAVLIVVGTFATGFLPSTPFYQVLSGGIIVAGFAVGYAGLGAFELLE
ncbi:hypothetical protein C444_18932 [Haloarcula japonica DSM 6131]|jgi:hypothetical protein|uniref:Uncharacterized protein n=4 Tax=Halobacteriales TaxID=2235 RepID=Q5V722_HALMA|nr:unknown [Haloarcula marismortui ATCC 43049]EMA27591.1 hypothetical protein C444_18932 [Haloarcula japonica DSM 6131]KAB7513670.1 hypothetical protein DMP03_11635 [Halosegnis rubeus]QCP89488.1 hypothetical protein E6P14_00705 [Haloarcula marismortui ATCC 43049]QZY04877.1 hypothetical protein K6T36_18285 [Halobaculum roseum]